MPAAFRSGKKVKKWPSSGQKRLKNGLQATEKRKCFRHQLKQCPKKHNFSTLSAFFHPCARSCFPCKQGQKVYLS